MGCSSSRSVSVSKQTFTFDYTPTKSNKGGSTGMVVALIRPEYAKTFTSRAELYNSFKTALGGDIEELIVGKGFNTKGPYLGYDEMTYEDKKIIDMAFLIEIAPEFKDNDGSWKSHLAIAEPGNYVYSYKGTISLTGKINISGVEPLTRQKLWSKSVQIPNIENIPVETSTKYKRPLRGDEVLLDPNIYNAIGNALQQQYSGILSKIEAHFSPEEFMSYSSQIKELKSKKVF